MPKKFSKKSFKKKPRTSQGPPTTALVYRGPVRPPGAAADQHTEIVFVSTGTVTSSGAGFVNVTVTNSAFANVEFSNMAGLWTEYRSLAMEVEFIPLAHSWWASAGGFTLQNSPPLVMVPLRNSAGLSAGSTTVQAYQVDGAKLFCIDQRTKVTWRMSSQPETSWINVGTNLPSASICIVGDSIQVATTVGNFYAKQLVQFRNRS